MANIDDTLYGDKALQLGFISKEQLQTARDAAQLVREGGGFLSLERILLKKGFISEFQASQIVKRIQESAPPSPPAVEEKPAPEKASDSAIAATFATPATGKPLEEEVLIDSITNLNLSAKDLMQDVPRTTIGRCHIIRKLGGGGIGTVYLAQHETLQKKVALKVLSDHLMQNREYIKRLEKEAVLTSKLDHPNIVQVYDAGIDQGKFYMVIQYVEGASLQSLIENSGKIAHTDATRIVAEVCKGLLYAHARGIVHRDIKPENILVSDRNEVRITDFHLAIDAEDITSSATRAILLGTPYFVSPELIQGEKADARSDIYSLGITLYYMVTGRRPFTGKSSIDVLMKHLKEKAINPRSLDPDLPEALCKIIAKMMAKVPEQRYQKVSSIIADFERMQKIDERSSTSIPVSTPVTRPLPIIPTLAPLPDAQEPALPVAEEAEPPPRFAPREPRRSPSYARRSAETNKSGSQILFATVCAIVIVALFLGAFLIRSKTQREGTPENRSAPPATGSVDRPIERIAPPTPADPVESEWKALLDRKKSEQNPALLRDGFLAYFNKYPEGHHAKEARDEFALYRVAAGEVQSPPALPPPTSGKPQPSDLEITAFKESLRKLVEAIPSLLQTGEAGGIAALFAPALGRQKTHFQHLFALVAIEFKEWKITDIRVADPLCHIDVSFNAGYSHRLMKTPLGSGSGNGMISLSKSESAWLIQAVSGDALPELLLRSDILVDRARQAELRAETEGFSSALQALRAGQSPDTVAKSFTALQQSIATEESVQRATRHGAILDAYAGVIALFRKCGAKPLADGGTIPYQDRWTAGSIAAIGENGVKLLVNESTVEKKFPDIPFSFLLSLIESSRKEAGITGAMLAHAAFIHRDYPAAWKRLESFSPDDGTAYRMIYEEGLVSHAEDLKMKGDVTALKEFIDTLLADQTIVLTPERREALKKIADEAK